jgi:hypothetical protein
MATRQERGGRKRGSLNKATLEAKQACAEIVGDLRALPS